MSENDVAHFLPSSLYGGSLAGECQGGATSVEKEGLVEWDEDTKFAADAAQAFLSLFCSNILAAFCMKPRKTTILSVGLLHFLC